MFQVNVPQGERVVRAVVAVAMLVAGSWWAVAADPVWGILVAAGGLGLGVSAASGWCPVCAAVGRTLPHVDKKVSIAKL